MLQQLTCTAERGLVFSGAYGSRQKDVGVVSGDRHHTA